MGIGAGISAIGALGSSLFTSSAASKAADEQAQAASNALGYQERVYSNTQSDLAPYQATGTAANTQLSSQLGQLSSQFSPTESSLESTPGYQFDLSQGLKSTQNSAAARGLGVSGAALKGASTYATGLADNTLNTQFNIDQTNKTNAYNKLAGTAGIGETAATSLGALGQQSANNTSNTLLSAAQGQSAATIASGTAFNPLLSSLGSYYSTANLGLNNGKLSQTNGLTNSLTSGYNSLTSSLANAF